MTFDDVSIMFGTKDIHTDLTILYPKLYIYKKRNSNKNLGIESFKAFIRYNIEVKKYIAFKNNRVKHFNESLKILKLLCE